MKDRFRFRAWYPDEKRMEYQEGKTPDWVGDILTNSYYQPMQSTGLTDRNGVEIFEGDVLGWPDDPSFNRLVVEWDYLGFRFNDCNRNNMRFNPGDLIVIGNRHETPEKLP